VTVADRTLIVNADDFGLSPGVNAGIIAAHEHGIVTSASLMVRAPAAAAAAAFARGRPQLAVGLHLDLGEWAYRAGTWVRLYEVVPPDDPAAVRAEVARQLAAFRRLMGRDPTHLDSHQHVHRTEPARTALAEVGGELAVPIRHLTPGLMYCGDFYGQDDEGRPYRELVTAAALVALLKRLPPGATELGCHPGTGDELDTMYVRERPLEVTALCDPTVCAAGADFGIKLVSFAEAMRGR
jgi:chitin disaccharide deacetylase